MDAERVVKLLSLTRLSGIEPVTDVIQVIAQAEAEAAAAEENRP